jgi:hypothetical protein
MFTIIFPLFYSIRQGLWSRAALHVEILALRPQLLVLQRSNGNGRPRLSFTDRLLWVWLSQLWINTSAFLGTNATDEPMTSGLPVIQP